MRKPSVTVGIAAYNEAANIGALLNDVLEQRERGYVREDVIVYSDGSSDNTYEIAARRKSSGVTAVLGERRRGLAYGLNYLMKNSKGDVLVVLNGDVRITDKSFVSKLIQPILANKAELTSTRIKDVPAKTIVEKSLSAGMRYKNAVFEAHKLGINAFTCHGPARAFSRKLYKKIKFQADIADDMYSYLYCKEKGFSYQYVRNTHVYYKLADNIRDHAIQSVRFLNSKSRMSRYFNSEFVSREYKLPTGLTVKYLVLSIVKDHFYMFVYIFLSIYMLVKAKLNPSMYTKNMLRASSSSKFFLLDK